MRRNLADAQVTAVSLKIRFDAAYKAAMQLSMAALLANGFRPSTGTGHHMTMIQSLPQSIGLERKRMIVLDALRRKRNAADYMGGYVDQSATDTCIGEAQALFVDVESWLADHRPDLIGLQHLRGHEMTSLYSEDILIEKPAIVFQRRTKLTLQYHEPLR